MAVVVSAIVVSVPVVSVPVVVVSVTVVSVAVVSVPVVSVPVVVVSVPVVDVGALIPIAAGGTAGACGPRHGQQNRLIGVTMKRRICLVGTAIAVVPFAVGISVAAAAGKSTTQKPTVKPVVLKCHMSLSTVPQPGSAAVDQPPSQGAQYGTIHCGGASFRFRAREEHFQGPRQR